VATEASKLTPRGADLGLRTRVASVVISIALIMGILLRFGVFFLSDRLGITMWITGNDASAFILLARNVVDHHGLSYAGVPSAYRPPLYPLLISVTMRINAQHWLVLVRLLQFVSALVAAWACGKLAQQWGGSRQIAIGLALWMPTLVFFQPEIGTETLAAMMTALWFVCLMYMSAPWSPAIVGVVRSGMVTGGEQELWQFPATAAVSLCSPGKTGRELPDTRTRWIEGFLYCH